MRSPRNWARYWAMVSACNMSFSSDWLVLSYCPIHGVREAFCGGDPGVMKLHRQQRGHQLDTVPQVLYPEILVEAVLIVVVIGDRHGDRRRVQDVLDHVERYAPAHGR